MKKSTVTVAFLMACLVSTQAQAHWTEWDGLFQVTAMGAACPAEPGMAAMRYAPRNIGTNGAGTRLTLLYGANAENWTLASGNLVGTGWQTVTATGIGQNAGQIVTKMRIRSQDPTTPNDATPKITIVGDIQNFGEDLGCNVSFIGTGWLTNGH